MKKILLSTLVAFVTLLATPVAAQFSKPELTIVPDGGNRFVMVFEVPPNETLEKVYVFHDYEHLRSGIPHVCGADQRSALKCSVDDGGVTTYVYSPAMILAGSHTFRVECFYVDTVVRNQITYVAPEQRTTDTVHNIDIVVEPYELASEVMLRVYAQDGREVYSARIPRPTNLQSPTLDTQSMPLSPGTYIGKLFPITKGEVRPERNMSNIKILII